MISEDRPCADFFACSKSTLLSSDCPCCLPGTSNGAEAAAKEPIKNQSLERRVNG